MQQVLSRKYGSSTFGRKTISKKKFFKGKLQLKILVVFTTKAWPLPPGKALVVQNRPKKITKLLSSWSDPGKKITKDLVVDPTPPPGFSINY